MKSLLLILALLSAQRPSRDSERTAVLPTNRTTITADYGGKYVSTEELSRRSIPAQILPKPLPSGLPWYVDVVNFGPNNVTIQGNVQFSVRLQPKDSVRMVVSNSIY
jgi:hypothetical protein